MSKTSFLQSHGHMECFFFFFFFFNGEALDFSFISQKRLIHANELILRRDTVVIFFLSFLFKIKK